MKTSSRLLVGFLLTCWGAVALADDYSETMTLFKNAGESATFFKNSYGYAWWSAARTATATSIPTASTWETPR